MDDISKLLNHDKVIFEVLDYLTQENTIFANIHGEAGTGKTYISKSIANYWADKNGIVLLMTGDHRHSDYDLYPWLVGMKEFSSGWQEIANSGARSTLNIIDKLVGTGGVATSIFDLFTSERRQRFERVVTTFTEKEREVLLAIRRYAKKGSLLLIADNLQWWDKRSLNLLNSLLGAEVRTSIPEINSLRVLAVNTLTLNTETSNTIVEQWRNIDPSCQWLTMPVTEKDYPQVLKFYGLTKKLSQSTLNTLYAITGGHLKLCEQLVLYLNSTNGDEEEYLYEFQDGDFKAIIAERLRSLGKSGKSIESYLKIAALLGLKFRENELLCSKDGKSVELLEVLTQSQNMGFIESEKGSYVFTHDIIRNHFLNQVRSSERIKLSIKLAECIRIIRPNDYLFRWKLACETQQLDMAKELFGLYAIAELRAGKPLGLISAEIHNKFPDDVILREFVKKIFHVYANIKRGVFEQQLPLLEGINLGGMFLWNAEKDYLVSLCLLESEVKSDANQSISILNSWIERLTNEIELKVRFELLLQQAYVQIGAFENAREIEKETQITLSERSGYDFFAKKQLYIQHRRSCSINVPEVAEQRIRLALRYFSSESEFSKDITEKYRVLNNLSAALIKLNKNEDALKYLLEIQSLFLEYPDYPFPRKDVVANNLIIVKYRVEKISLNEAIKEQKSIVEFEHGKDEKLMTTYNYYAYQLLNGINIFELESFSALLNSVYKDEFSDSYIRYYVSNLRIAGCVLNKDYEGAKRALKNEGTFIYSLNWPTASYIKHRFELLKKSLDQPKELSILTSIELDSFLYKSYPKEIGPAWRHISKLVPLCELDFWLDS